MQLSADDLAALEEIGLRKMIRTGAEICENVHSQGLESVLATGRVAAEWPRE